MPRPASVASVRDAHGAHALSGVVNDAGIVVAGPLEFLRLGPCAASKFVVEALSDALRRELQPWDLPVVRVEPGAVASVVRRALLAPRPHTRYLVGRDARVVALLARWLPDRTLDRLTQQPRPRSPRDGGRLGPSACAPLEADRRRRQEATRQPSVPDRSRVARQGVRAAGHPLSPGPPPSR